MQETFSLPRRARNRLQGERFIKGFQTDAWKPRPVRHDGSRDASPATDRPVAIIPVTPNHGRARAIVSTGAIDGLDMKVTIT